MKLFTELTDKDIGFLSNVDVQIEDRDYSRNELNHFCIKIEEYIMSHSIKNSDIIRLSQQYDNILNLIEKF